MGCRAGVMMKKGRLTVSLREAALTYLIDNLCFILE